MPKIEWWPFMARTMVEDHDRVKPLRALQIGAGACGK
jgi:hypothetical protein